MKTKEQIRTQYLEIHNEMTHVPYPSIERQDQLQREEFVLIEEVRRMGLEPNDVFYL